MIGIVARNGPPEAVTTTKENASVTTDLSHFNTDPYALLNDTIRAAADTYQATLGEILAELDIADPDETDYDARRIPRYRREGKPAIILHLSGLARWDMAFSALYDVIKQQPIAAWCDGHPDAVALAAAYEYRDEARDTFDMWRRIVHDAALVALLFPGQAEAPQYLAPAYH